MKDPASDSTLVRAVSRALTILTVMAREESPLGLVAISRLVDLDPTTTHRLLHTMEAHGFVAQDPADGKYSLGIQAFQIGSSVTHVSVLRQVSRPFLQTLMERTGETANLAIRGGNQVAYVEQVTGTHFLRTVTEVGRSVPLHCTAVGKALLMGVDDAEIRQIAGAGLKRYTPNTITSAEALATEISRCRKQGYTVDMEEFESGARCLGAPIMGADGRVFCALSISGPVTRMPIERIQTLIPMITKSAAEITQTLKFANASFF